MHGKGGRTMICRAGEQGEDGGCSSYLPTEPGKDLSHFQFSISEAFCLASVATLAHVFTLIKLLHLKHVGIN
jgi:hypothetical protein